jgi:ABC-type lipoprotein release transport system permease subunit
MLFLDNATTKKFLIGVWVGLAFSIAVILSTVGIMDGFERALRQGLKKSSGDVTMQSRYGFFQVSDNLKNKLQDSNILTYSALVQTESFLIHNDESRGVQVKAVDESYGKVVGIPFILPAHSVAIGSEIARIHKVAVGDEVVLAFGKGGAEFKNMPALTRFKVAEIINHGVYQKDSRMVYARLDEVQAMLGLSNRVNMVAFNVERTKVQQDDLKTIENKLVDLRMKFDQDYYFKPYWREYSSLIEAVQAEKVLISLILQLIVVIAIFNVLAFIYFINEKKAKELFLFKALGLSRKSMNNLWIKLVVGIWFASSAMAAVLVQVFRFLLLHVSLFKLPAEVYHMPRIDLFLSWQDYVLVYSLALLWMLLITYYLLRKLKNKSLLEGLRQEFV